MNATAASLQTLDGILRAELARARTGQHRGEQGTRAEDAWLRFLAERLPNRYQVGRGEIFDSTGGYSEQQDVVLYDPQYSPLVLGGDEPLIVAEAVYGVVEVKPELSQETFEYAKEKAASVRRLTRTSVPIYYVGGQFPAKPPVPQLAGLVADRSGWVADTTVDHIQKLLVTDTSADAIEAIDLVYADEVAASHLVNPETGDRELHVHSGQGALAWFLLEMLRGLSYLGTVAAIDYTAYRDLLTHSVG